MVLGAWLAGLAVVVGLGVLGDRTPDGGVVAVASPTPRGTAPDAPSRPPVDGSSIVLEHPYREGAIVRPTDLVVTGYLRQGVGPVRVIVETSRNKPLAVEQIDATTGTARTARPRFTATMPVGDRHEGERLIIHVISYDPDGLPIDVLRRRVIIGPQEPWVIGEDGLMGGLAFPSATPPRQP